MAGTCVITVYFVCFLFFLFKTGLKRLNNPFDSTLRYTTISLKIRRMKKTVKDGQIPPSAWMVLVINGILCLYYFYCRGIESCFYGSKEQDGNEKESAYTTLGRDLGASGKLALHWGIPEFTYYRSAQGRGAKHLGNISFLLKALSLTLLGPQYLSHLLTLLLILPQSDVINVTWHGRRDDRKKVIALA
ncbi:uncharacterized protein BKA55DRAFT_375110 [Fusarium redolens]|jgi:hypothetical protein|uniref:Uncharacterized protein n=1 Tax=Fusarium redolens TaxID=48865 RepID=A0A9P9KEP6_FUSRE|nr:uncharacterized protein BKA55DRAFT_375110 [Fusarium redolens]KAH7250199.1 hypothetical protein BKA55DRAFT_375110 [Fusarium redolens]